VEARFAAQIQGRLDEVIAEYLVRFGTVIDTDRARELCGDYSATKATRTRFSRAVYNPAKALADEIYRREIRKTAPPRGWRVLFTSGGTGAGKSTALAWLEETSEPDDRYDILVDGRLSDYATARAKIRRALALGHSVTVVHVHREFAETVRTVVKRAIEMGRAVTLDNIAATHFRSKRRCSNSRKSSASGSTSALLRTPAMNRHGPFPWRNWQPNDARALTTCANWRTLFLSMNSAASKLITRKSMKPSSKKVLPR
jgi:hypothetical protein